MMQPIRTVAQVTRRTVGRVVTITLTDPVTHQSQTLTATEDHPFYVQGKGFVPAGQLGVGTSIVTRAGPALTVSGSHLLPQQVGGYTVYNLTVEGDHTYFVGSISGGAWVHNSDCSIWSKGPGGNSVKNAFSHWSKHKGEFPEYMNAKQYVEAAEDFTQNLSAETLIKNRSNGDTLFYHPGSNTFAVTDSTGAPKTMFRPGGGMSYWKSQ